MEENKNENTPIKDVKEKKNTNFKAVTNSSMYNTKKSKSGFGRSVVLPFCSGVIGCVVVIGTCFGVPSIRSKILNNTSNTIINNTSSSTSSNNGYVSQVNLSNYSDTAVYAANKILPSIVGIKLEYTVNNSMLQIFGKSASSTATATGSGIIISEDGYILTNNHVVDTSSSNSSYSYYDISDATSVKVKLNSSTYGDDATYDAKIVGKDSQTDLAVLKIDKTDLTAAEFGDSEQAVVGEFVMAVGSPLGLDTTVTQGIISAVNREVESDGTKYTCIQTDAAINSGNSGGALVNSEGKVIGINTLKLSGSGVEGIGFAIPINSTLDVTSQLIDHNKVLRPYIGISGINLDESTAKKYNLTVGVYVKTVQNFSPAEKSGLQAGDVIIKADDKDITTMDELNEIKNSHKIGDTMKLKINRSGEEKEMTITLEETP